MKNKLLLKGIAHHEAARTVTALQFGFGVPEVDIVGNAKTHGLTHVAVPKPNGEGKKYISTIFNDAVVDHAGLIVNVRDWAGDQFRDTRDLGAWDKVVFYCGKTRYN